MAKHILGTKVTLKLTELAAVLKVKHSRDLVKIPHLNCSCLNFKAGQGVEYMATWTIV